MSNSSNDDQPPTPAAFDTRPERAVSRPAISPQPRRRVAIANRSDGGIAFWVAKLYGFAFITVFMLTVLSAFAGYGYFARTTAPVPDWRSYAQIAPGVTRIYAGDDTLLGEFAKEWRELVPYDQMPPQLIDAVLAVEDHQFFEHHGISFKGIARAAWANLTSGDFEQGGSTITQQVAKQFLRTDKSLSRKAREAIMARRLEARYSKKAILSFYLNHIYLGAGAYGVAAAAHRYFQKHPDDLTLAEMALIAGLPKAPSAFSPITNPTAAIERRNVVIDQMVRWRGLDSAKAAIAKAEPLKLNVYQDVFPSRMPYYAEHVRRYIVERYGIDGLMKGGLRVEAAVEPAFDAGADGNIDYATHHQDKRQGWRGPEWYVDGPARDTLIARQRERYGYGPLEPERRYLAIVDDAKCDRATVVVGDRQLDLPLNNMRWAAPWSATNAENDHEITCANRALKRGDVIWVKRELRTRGRFREYFLPDKINPSWRGVENDQNWNDRHPDIVQLDQVPHPQGALFTADHRTGYVLAMVGGYDYARSELNRVVQSCRQPGSTYKPIYYSAALDAGFGFDSMFYDRPVEIVDPVTGEVWTPTNLGGTVDNDVTLEYALVFSKNIPSVAIFSEVGATNVEAWARRLGFTSQIIADKALALGASCTYINELARAFAIFARNGRWIDWAFVRRVLDRDGKPLEDHTVYFDPMLAGRDRLDRLAATAGLQPNQAISARTAFLTSKLLSRMVEYGFTKTLKATGIHAAGKTGTSSATMDNSFVAFTSRLLTAVWLGDDKRVRELGKKDAAYMTVVPLWARYMYEVARDFPNPEIPWEVPSGVDAKDRGAHSRGRRGGQMALIYRHAEKPPDELEEGVEGAAPAATPAPP